MTQNTGSFTYEIETELSLSLTCSLCNETKPVSEFYRDSSKATGYSSWCKRCTLLKEQAYRAGANITLDASRTFGVEIELLLPHRSEVLASHLRNRGIECYVEGYNHVDKQNWKIITDASLTSEGHFAALELVSPPLRGAEGISDLKAVCQVLKSLGAKVNRSCGLHVHHDANNLDLDAWKNLIRNYIKYEEVIDELMPPSRRGNNNHYAQSLTSDYSKASMFRRVQNCEHIHDIRYLFGHRFTKLNTEAFSLHGTVEFRQHTGTVEFSKIINWVALTQGMVIQAAASVEVTLTEATPTFDSLMTDVAAQRPVKKFFSQRRVALAAWS